DDVVDRSQPDRLETALEPVRARADLHAANRPHGIERASREVLDPRDRRFLARGWNLDLRGSKLHPTVRGDFTRQSDVAEPVRTVRGDLDLEHRLRRKHFSN